MKNTTLEVIHYTEITKANQPSNLSDAPTAVQHPPKEKDKLKGKEKEKEKSVAVKESDSTIVVKRRASSDLIPVPEGSMVEGNYRGKGVWFSGTVMRAFEGLGVEGGRGNALYDIQYDDGEVERGMEAWYVRVKTPVAGEPVRAAVPSASLPVHTQPISQPSTAPAVAAATAVGTQKAQVQADMSAVSVSGSAATATVVKGDSAAVLAKTTGTAVKHTDTASSVPVSLGTEKKAIAVMTSTAAAATTVAAASRAADVTAVSASKASASTTGTVTANATAPAPSTVAATSSSQSSTTTTAPQEPGGMGGAQNKVADKAEPSRPTAPATATVTAASAASVAAPSVASSTVNLPLQATNGASSAAATTAASASAASSNTQAAVRPSSASTSATSWAKTTPSPWTQKPQEGVEEGVKGPVRPGSAAPSRALAVDTAHRRGSDPDPFDDSTESIEKGLKKGLGLGLDPKVQGLSAQPVRELEGALKQPAVPKDQAVKEVVKGVRGEVVPPLKLAGVMDEIKEGSLVEGNYAQIGEWFTGKITKKRSDGSYDILYDDGDVELGVRPPFVRLSR